MASMWLSNKFGAQCPELDFLFIIKIISVSVDLLFRRVKFKMSESLLRWEDKAGLLEACSVISGFYSHSFSNDKFHHFSSLLVCFSREYLLF